MGANGANGRGFTSAAVSHRITPELEAFRADLWVRIGSLLRTREWECLRMYALEGFTQEEIAVESKIDQPSVSRAIERARAKLAANKEIKRELYEVIDEMGRAKARSMQTATIATDDEFDEAYEMDEDDDDESSGDPLRHLRARGTWGEGTRDDS